MQAETLLAHTQYSPYIAVSLSQTPDFEIRAEGSCQKQISRPQKYIRENLTIHPPLSHLFVSLVPFPFFINRKT
jgi:hypothetical protein